MQKISLKARALRFLSAREHSRVELAKKLARHASDGDDIGALLDELEVAKFLSVERFAESLLNRRAARFGNSRILRELQEHGVEGETLVGIKAGLAQDEAVRAMEVWRRKFNQPPCDAAERARQMRFLLQRGFSMEAIRAVLRAATASDD